MPYFPDNSQTVATISGSVVASLEQFFGVPSGSSSGIVTRPIAQAASSSFYYPAVSVSLIQLVAANGERKGMTLFNDSGKNLSLRLAPSGSDGTFSIKMAARSYYELPEPVYTGALSGFWDASDAAGRLRVTELT